MLIKLQIFLSLITVFFYLYGYVRCETMKIDPMIAKELKLKKMENLLTLFRVVNNVEAKIRNGKLDELNFFEKWIIALLVKRSRETMKKLYSDQKQFWTFRQG
jgi:hypothetical protein